MQKLSGWLYKKKRESKKSYLTSKYQKRWFELTSDTLVYTSIPGALKDGTGRIEVFAIHEIKWLKEIDNDKLEIRFPERILRLKSEEGEDIGRWKIAIEDCQVERQRYLNDAKAQKLEQLKQKNVKTLLVESSDDDGDVTTESSLRQSKPSSPELEPGCDQSLGETRKPSRPPSPRSLLSNPRVGERYVTPNSSMGRANEPTGDWSQENEEPRHKPPMRGRARAREAEEDRLVLEPSKPRAPARRVAAPSDSERLLLDTEQTVPTKKQPVQSAPKPQARHQQQTVKTTDCDNGDKDWLDDDWDADDEEEYSKHTRNARNAGMKSTKSHENIANIEPEPLNVSRSANSSPSKAKFSRGSNQTASPRVPSRLNESTTASSPQRAPRPPSVTTEDHRSKTTASPRVQQESVEEAYSNRPAPRNNSKQAANRHVTEGADDDWLDENWDD